MLRRGASWREKQKTPEYHAALIKTRSFILKAVNIDYEDVSCEGQNSEFTGQTGPMSVHATLSSDSLDMGEELEVTSIPDICATGTAPQDYCENNVAVCSVGTEQPNNSVGQCSKTVGQSGIFYTVSVHTTSPSESLDLVWEEENCSIVQTYESQDGDENKADVSPLMKLNEQLSLGAVAGAGSAKRQLQADVGVHESVPERDDDPDSTAHCTPHALLTSPVPTEHQELNSTRVSSDVDKEVILKVADQLSLADEVCEVEGDAEQCTEVRICGGMVNAARVLKLSHTATL
jgi:hypothetical protein